MENKIELFKKEDLELFKKGNLAVNCKTKELAKDFLAWCGSNKITLPSNNATFFDTYSQYTCYTCIYNIINYSRIHIYIDKYYLIKEYRGFNKENGVIGLENKKYRYLLECRINYTPIEAIVIDESYMDLNTLLLRYFEIKSKYDKEDIEYLNVFKYELKPFSIKEAITELEDV